MHRLKKVVNKNSLIGLLILGICMGCVYWYFVYQQTHPSTDNAYVNANLINIAPKVGGYIKKIYVKDNQYVKKGDALLLIDPKDYSLLIQKAKAGLAASEQEATYAQENIENAKINRANALSDYNFSEQISKRYTDLFKSKAGSMQDMQKYQNKSTQARHALENANTTLNQAKLQFEMANTKIETAKIALRNAKINLSYAHINAPADGYISNLNLHSGQLVLPGQKLFGLVDDTHWWVDANMKETKLSRIKINQSATFTLDMYDHTYEGKVESISYASGSTFSLLPAENATGNWVKVVQYFTVRISVKNHPDFPLRVNASAHVVINTTKNA